MSGRTETAALPPDQGVMTVKTFVVTISREYGSGGRTIGRMLSESLGIPFYDTELMRLASDDSGINEALFLNADEKLKPSLLRKPGRAYKGGVIPPGSGDFVSTENLFNYVAKVIRDLADRESCVIIGRCAEYILRDRSNVLRIYVHAPFDACVRATMEVHGNLSADEAARYMQRVDKRRGEYYRYFTGREWKAADNYDLCLNSSDLGWEKCVALVKSYLEIKMG